MLKSSPTWSAMLVAGLALISTGCAQNEYSVDIQRVFSNALEQQFIQIAESTYPPREDVIAAAGQDSPDFPPDHLWWYGYFDGVRLPYTVTSEAVAYYDALVVNDRRQGGLFVLLAPLSTETLKYAAHVESLASYARDGQTFTDVYVVTLDLNFERVTGPTNAIGFEKSKIVVFNSAGEVLAVFGDGRAIVAVS